MEKKILASALVMLSASTSLAEALDQQSLVFLNADQVLLVRSEHEVTEAVRVLRANQIPAILHQDIDQAVIGSLSLDETVSQIGKILGSSVQIRVLDINTVSLATQDAF